MKETILIRGVEYIATARTGSFQHPQMVAKLVRLQRASDAKFVFGKNS
jgi:hypothetical protein